MRATGHWQSRRETATRSKDREWHQVVEIGGVKHVVRLERDAVGAADDVMYFPVRKLISVPT